MNPFLAYVRGEDDPLVKKLAAERPPESIRQLIAQAPVTLATPAGAADAPSASPVTNRMPAQVNPDTATLSAPPLATENAARVPATQGMTDNATRETVAQNQTAARLPRFKLPPVDRMVERFQEWQAIAASTPGVGEIVAPQLDAWRNLTVQQHARSFEGDPTESPEQAAAYARHMGHINGMLGKPMTWDEAARIAEYVEDREDGATQRFLKAVGTGNIKGAQEWIDTVFGQDVTIVDKEPTKTLIHGAEVDDWKWMVKLPDGSQQSYTGTQLNHMYGDQQARVQYAQRERLRQIEHAKLELENARVLGDPAKVGAAYRKLMEVQGVSGGVTTANLPEGLAPYAPFLGRLRGRESGGDINAVSVQNAVGLDQFTQQRLDDYNQQMGLKGNDRVTVEALKNNVPLQNQIAAWHYPDIDRFITDNGLTQYLGQTIKGVTVTLDGMRAAAHLGGSPGLKRFLETKGEEDPADGLGTRRVDYLRKFQGETVPLGGGPAVALDADDAAIGARILQAGAPAAAKGAAPADMTKTQEKAFEAWSKERQEIQKSMDSDAVKQRRLDELNDFYAPVLGNVIPGLMSGLTPEEAAIFGTGGGPGGATTGGTSGATPGGTGTGNGTPATGGSVPTTPPPERGLMDSVTGQLKSEAEAKQKAADIKAQATDLDRAFREAVTEAQAAMAGDVTKTQSALDKMEKVYKVVPKDKQVQLERLARILLASKPQGAGANPPATASAGAAGYLPYPW